MSEYASPISADTMPYVSIRVAKSAVFLGRVLLLLFLGLFGALIGRWLGAALCVVLASVYIWIAAIASERYPLDLHNGQVIDGDRAPETTKFVKELSDYLGIYPPDLYYIEVDQPQVCVCAKGYGAKMHGRIGISKALLREADAGKLRVLLSLAIARVWSGHASATSSLVTLTGLGFQVAQSDGLNSLPTPKSRDASTELSPVGGFAVSVCSAVVCQLLNRAGAKQLVFDADSAALNMGKYSYKPEYIDSSLRWLASKQFPQVQHPIAIYNPVETLLYLVSPFETEFSKSLDDAPEQPWRKHVENVTCLMPTIDERVAHLRSTKPSEPIVVIEPHPGSEVTV